MPLIKPPLPDPSLDVFDHGVGVLTRNGRFAGNAATTLGWFWSPFAPLRRQWWVWYLVLWADGTREHPAEDYPPEFLAVNEMKSGFLDLAGTSRDGRYDFAWLSAEDAASTRDRLGITDQDF